MEEFEIKNEMDNQWNDQFQFIADENGIKMVFTGIYYGNPTPQIPSGCFLTIRVAVGVFPHETKYIPVSLMKAWLHESIGEHWNARYAYEVIENLEKKYDGVDPDIIQMLNDFKADTDTKEG